MGKKGKKQHEEDVEMTSHEHGQCSCHQDEDQCECGGDCCCGSEEFEQPHLIRQFYTKAEKIVMLEEYLEDLKAEAAAVEEELADLRK